MVGEGGGLAVARRRLDSEAGVVVREGQPAERYGIHLDRPGEPTASGGEPMLEAVIFLE
jgi:hypothetical protein